MLIGVDFDGTIVEHKYPAIGEERPFATEVLRKFIEDRHMLVLWTMREGKLLEDAVNWCKERGVVFYSINSVSPGIFMEKRNENLSVKLNADVFIDDLNVGGLPSWTDIYEIISHHKTYEQIIRHRVKQELSAQAPAEPPYPKWMFWKKKNSHRRHR